MSHIENKFLNKMEKLQNDCHIFTDDMMKNSKSSTIQYQDITNIWLFNKLAEYELRIEELENSKENNY